MKTTHDLEKLRTNASSAESAVPTGLVAWLMTTPALKRLGSQRDLTHGAEAAVLMRVSVMACGMFGLCIFFCLIVMDAKAGSRASASYSVPADSVDSGGVRTSSA